MSVKNLPYEYYSLPYCRPEKIIASAENLGEVLRGDRIDNSPYQVCASSWSTEPGGVDVRPWPHSFWRWRPDCSARSAAPGGRWPPPARHLSDLRDSPGLQGDFRVDEQCKVLCRIASLNKAQADAFKSRIADEYRVNM